MSEEKRVTTAGGYIIVGDRALEPQEVERYVRMGVTYEEWLETIWRDIDKKADRIQNEEKK